MFDSAMRTLSQLPDFVPVTPQDPQTIVSSSSTNDGQSALAVVEDDPGIPGNQFNVFRVVNRNARLQTNDVRTNDIVRYFALTDAQFGKAQYVELRVAAVLDQHRLRTEQVLLGQIAVPFRMEVWRERNEIRDEVASLLETYYRDGIPAHGWEASPEMRVLNNALGQVRAWALEQNDAELSWRPTELIKTLPESLRKLSVLNDLDALQFPPTDNRAVMEGFWLGSIAKRAAGEFGDPLSQANSLFNWVVDNVQLFNDGIEVAKLEVDERGAPESTPAIDKRDPVGPNRIWKILLYGQGNAEQRAWVFMCLGRQLGLDIVPLSFKKAAAGFDEYWCCGLLHNGQIYLFDTQLGLPITIGPERQIATLEQARKDASVLRGLDLPGRPYAVNIEDIQRVNGLVGCGPEYLSKRMALVSKYSPSHSPFYLTEDLDDLAPRVAKVLGEGEIRIWEFPYQTLRGEENLNGEQRRRLWLKFRTYALASLPVLWKARHCQMMGILEGAEEGDFDALKLYMMARPSFLQMARAQMSPELQDYTLSIKRESTYWLGVLKLHGTEPAPQVAIDWLRDRLLTSEPDGPRADAALFHIAHAYEALGDIPKAIETYEKTAGGPQGQGNLLRARLLRMKAGMPVDAVTAPEQTPKSADVAPASEQPATEQPATEQPATEQPATEQPATEQPATEQPATEQPASEQPASEQPASEQPASEQPATEQPASEQPASEQPATEQPATEQK